jgi:hypothetical protein
MQGIKPCPYCGGEVEMVKLNKKRGEKKDYFRIECRQCHKLVVRGIGFSNETLDDSQERIKQYEKFVKDRLYPGMTTRFRQSDAAKRRDKEAKRFFWEV